MKKMRKEFSYKKIKCETFVTKIPRKEGQAQGMVTVICRTLDNKIAKSLNALPAKMDDAIKQAQDYIKERIDGIQIEESLKEKGFKQTDNINTKTTK